MLCNEREEDTSPCALSTSSYGVSAEGISVNRPRPLSPLAAAQRPRTLVSVWTWTGEGLWTGGGGALDGRGGTLDERQDGWVG